MFSKADTGRTTFWGPCSAALLLKMIISYSYLIISARRRSTGFLIFLFLVEKKFLKMFDSFYPAAEKVGSSMFGHFRDPDVDFDIKINVNTT